LNSQCENNGNFKYLCTKTEKSECCPKQYQTTVTSATSQLVTRSSHHKVMSSLGQLVTSQLVTGAFFSQSHLVTRSSYHTVILLQAAP